MLRVASSLCMYGAGFVEQSIFLILREDLSILPQKDTLLRLNDIMVIREETTDGTCII